MLEEIVKEKMILNKNRLYKINKYLLWYITAKDIVIEFMNKELNKEKILECIAFLIKINYKDIFYDTNNNYKVLRLRDDDYDIEFKLYDEFEIEYTVNSSNICYKFTVSDYQDRLNNSNIIYNTLKDNINNILNDNIFNICKKYILNN